MKIKNNLYRATQKFALMWRKKAKVVLVTKCAIWYFLLLLYRLDKAVGKLIFLWLQYGVANIWDRLLQFCACGIDTHMWLSLRLHIWGLSNCTWPAINYVLQGCEKSPQSPVKPVSWRVSRPDLFFFKSDTPFQIFLVSNSHLLAWKVNSPGCILIFLWF